MPVRPLRPVRRVACATLLLGLLAGCRGDAVVRGVATLGEAVAPGARLEVTLLDAAGRVRASTAHDSLGAPPWAFALPVSGAAAGRDGARVAARLVRLGQSAYETGVAVSVDPATGAVRDTLRLQAAQGRIARGAASAPDSTLAALRARRGAWARVGDQAMLGTTASEWRVWFDGDAPQLIEESMEPAEGGRSTLAYAFEAGRLVAFEEHGERAALLPGRPATLARIDVQIRWPAAGGPPEVSHRIEGLDALPDHALVPQVLARAERLLALAREKRAAR